MIDTSKLPLFLKEDIASNLGWDKVEPIEPYLERVSKMTPERALGCFAEWRLGDKDWAYIFINGIDALRKADNQPAPAGGGEQSKATKGK